MESATLIRGVNETLTPTWNYLRINGIDVEVPNLDQVTPARAPIERFPGGLGADASQWLQRAAARQLDVVLTHGKREEAPIVVEADADTGEVVDASVMMNDGSEATIVVVERSREQGSQTCGVRLRLDLGANAKAHVFVYTALHEGYQALTDVGAKVADDAALDVRVFSLGAGLAACGVRSENSGFRSAADVDVRYLGRGDERIDLGSTLVLSGKKSTADFSAYGVLTDRASKTLRDTIDLVHGAKGAQGNENETVLLAGHDVTNKSIPTVLCDEDDVVGNHGASIGTVSEAQLAYLNARGLDDDAARALLSRAVLDSAIAQAPCDEAREAALAVASRILGEDEAAEIDAERSE